MCRTGENIYKRKDGRWEGRYIKGRHIDGKAKYGYVYAPTYHEVKQKLTHALDTVRDNEHRLMEMRSDITFNKASGAWLENIYPQIKESTAVKYQNLIHLYLSGPFGNNLLTDISREYLEKYTHNLLTKGGKNEEGLSPKTVADILSIVRSIFKYYAAKGYNVDMNIMEVTVKQKRKEMRVLSRMEQEKLCRHLYSHMNHRNLGILLSLYTGLRVGEICALRWEDISLSEKIITVRHTMQRLQSNNNHTAKTKVIISMPKSACSIRKIPLTDHMIRTLSEFSHCQKGYLLTGRENCYVEPRNMQNYFKKVLKDADLNDINYHALRHTFATRCVELGFDVKSLSEILGHASVNITMNRYVHPSMELKRANMQRLSELFSVNEMVI